jgi:hypothetical protein
VGECCHFAGGEGRHFLLLFFKETGRQKGICKRRLLPYIRYVLYTQDHNINIPNPKPLFSLLSSTTYQKIPTHSYCLFHAMPGLNSMA